MNNKMQLFRKQLKFIFVFLVLMVLFFLISRIIFSPEQNQVFIKHDKSISTSVNKMVEHLDGTIKAKMSSAMDPTTKEGLQKDDFGRFHVVTNFVPFNNKELRHNLQIDGRPPTDQQMEARMAEIFECLQRNLNNSMIAFVHVLVFHEEAITYLQSLKLRNSHKLIIHKNDRWPTMLDQLMYASEYLQGKIVVMCHQDNYIGEGWEKVNVTVLKRERLMYALTRHPSPSKCSGTTKSANCGMGYPYIGSHDTFVFYAYGPMTRDRLVEIDVTPNTYGMENILIWIFRTRFNYRVLNPCLVLVVYHEHCIPIREVGRKRINDDGNSAWVSFTDQLQ